MAQNNNSTMEMQGSIRLTDLAYAQLDDSGQWLQIPIAANPSLFVTTDKKTGKPNVDLDITIWRSNQPRYGNTHYIRASVGKRNGEHLTDEQKRAASMILGNARLHTPAEAQRPAPVPAAPGFAGGYAQGGPYPPQPGQQAAPGYGQAPAAPGYGQAQVPQYPPRQTGAVQQPYPQAPGAPGDLP